MKIFISYAHADQKFVERLDAELSKHGIDAWYDRKPSVGLRGGERWEDRLASELNASAVVLVVLSPDSTRAGSFVANEYQFAINKGARVIPLLYQDCTVPLSLSSLQHIDFVHKSFANAFADLLTALNVPHPPPIPIAPNPFTDTSRIDDPTRFFGRASEVSRILYALAHHDCVSVIGNRQIGKSSLLVFIAKQGAAQIPNTRFVYLSLHICKDDKAFFMHVCQRLNGNGIRDRDLSRLLLNSSVRVVLCLDEMETMNAPSFRGAEHVRWFLRGMAEGQDAPLKIVTASCEPLAQLFAADLAPGKPSPFHNLFVEHVKLGNFSRADCDQFLNTRLQNTNVTFDATTRDEIWTLTQGHPYKLQRAAYHRYQYAIDPTHDWRAAFNQDALLVK